MKKEIINKYSILKIGDRLEFNIYPNNDKLRAVYYSKTDKLNLLFNSPQGQYYSFKNDAFETIREIVNTKN